jgi:hypothetical protein
LFYPTIGFNRLFHSVSLVGEKNTNKGSGLELPRKEIAKFEVRHLAKRMMVHTPCLRLFAKRYETLPAEKIMD